jgi:hypothetical protein
MIRTAALAKRASDLSRRLYASLPLGYRIARLLINITASDNTAFGYLMYTLFIRAGVTNIPDINGHPALDLQPALQTNLNVVNLADRHALSSISGNFGEFVYATFLKKFHRPDAVREGMDRTRDKLLENQNLIKPVNIKKAQNFVMLLVEHETLSAMRHQRRLREDQFLLDDEGHEIDLEGPKGFNALENLLPPPVMRHVLHELEAIHPLGPIWLEANLEGGEKGDVTQREIAEQYMAKFPEKNLGRSRVNQLLLKYEPKFKKVLLNHIRDVA